VLLPRRRSACKFAMCRVPVLIPSLTKKMIFLAFLLLAAKADLVLKSPAPAIARDPFLKKFLLFMNVRLIYFLIYAANSSLDYRSWIVYIELTYLRNSSYFYNYEGANNRG
jgi:hypothetical protein